MRSAFFSRFALLAVIAVAALCAAPANMAAAQTAQPTPARLSAEGLVRADQLDRGALLFNTDTPGYYVPAPLLSTKIEIDVTGPIARTKLTQKFTNPADVFVEGRYLFPLPEGAAVDTLRMRVGDRLIEGDIEERKKAKEIYEKAKAEGFVASLVEQQRPNVFTTSVANIAPKATIVIQIEYQETLQPRDGAYGLRVPLVVAPRYESGAGALLARFTAGGWVPAAAAPAPGEEGSVSAAMVDPDQLEPGEINNPVDIQVSLDAGFPLGVVKSLYHRVIVDATGTDTAEIRLDGPAPADRDFYLSWAAEGLSEPEVRLFTEESGEQRHYLMLLAPPAEEAIAADAPPREVVFVQDVSGSMSYRGPDDAKSSMEQAKAGLALALRRLRPTDTFNIVVFNDRFAPFSLEPAPATPQNIAQALQAVTALQPDGGTEMLPALEFALADNTPNDGRIRQVIFLTDGAVSNERAMLELIRRDLGASRLFTIGIGAAPNSYFMTAAAEAGRGAHVFIGDLGEVEERMASLFSKIETPALTDLQVRVAGIGEAEIFPNPMPDLYVGDPLAVAIAIDPDTIGGAQPQVTLSGDQGGRTWIKSVALVDAKPRPGVGKLSAKRRIESLEALRLSPEVTETEKEQIDAEILQTALDSELVSRLTSLVAVDITPTRPSSLGFASADVLLNLPDGWDPEVFRGAPSFDAAPADGGPPLIEKAALNRLAAAATQRAASLAAGAAPPQTALGWRGQLLLAIGMLLAGGGALLWARRRRRAAS